MIFNPTFAGSGGGGGSVETAIIGLYSINSFQPEHIYYTDANMTVQHTTDGYVSGQLPVGSIIYCHGNAGPAAYMQTDNYGVTALYQEASFRALYAAYKVTG